jgi:divalent metal cation (Fe/Co/Zn/Cd) transporter
MDQTDPALHKQITAVLTKETAERHLDFHHLRHRMSGQRVQIEFHLLFPKDINLGKAHEAASEIEAKLQESLALPAEISSHLEPKMHHDDIHEKYGLPI